LHHPATGNPEASLPTNKSIALAATALPAFSGQI
jgi:hypothetical protein